MENKRETVISHNNNGLTFNSESMIEEGKWDTPLLNDHEDSLKRKRSSNGGFFHGKMKQGANG